MEEFASKLSVGSSQILVTLRDAGTGEGIDDARVVVRTKHDLSGDEGWVTALSFPNEPNLYKAQVSLTAPGKWRLWVEVDGRLGRVEVEILPMEIPALRSYSSGSFIFIGVFMILVLGATYLWWSSRKALRERGAAQELPEDSGRDTGAGSDEAGE
ncbi:MAG: FixH family protein [Chloroflexi bacterium]|nr:FixH family protein [Chloroflexota bacterium]